MAYPRILLRSLQSAHISRANSCETVKYLAGDFGKARKPL